ncbi:hypothetical protein H0H92_007550 [Tricholoma furcatifolium]|nr:hypothetical protein H0H92_007550 [Tricholoma furcatifolium]
MTSVTLIEQRPPFILLLASRGTTYMHVVISILAVVLISVSPSWAMSMPPTRAISRKPRSNSFTSTTTTLVEPTGETEVSAERDVSENAPLRHASFSGAKNPFQGLGSHIKLAISRTRSKSESISAPLARRLSMPARRFSSHVVTAIHNMTPHLHHHHHHEETDSYFPQLQTTDTEAETSEASVVPVACEESKVCSDDVAQESIRSLESANFATQSDAEHSESSVAGVEVGTEESKAPETIVLFTKRRTVFQRAAKRLSSVAQRISHRRN